MKRLVGLSLLLVGLLFPASAVAVKVKATYEPLMPSLEFTIECEGEYGFERCAEWEFEAPSAGFYYRYPAIPGGKANSRIGRFSNPKGGEFEMPYDCDLTEDFGWTVNATTKRGTVETTSGEADFPFLSTLCIDPYKNHLRASKREAENEVLKHLKYFYVSRLRCRRAGLGFKCETIYSTTYRACRALFRVDKWFEHSYGGDRVFVQAYPVRRRCVSF